MRIYHYPIIFGLAVMLTIISCQKQPGISQLLVEEGNAASADGIPIHYKLYGKGEVSLVFVHAWCTNLTFDKYHIKIYISSF